MKKHVEVITFKKFPGMKEHDYFFKSWFECSKEIEKIELGNTIAIHDFKNIYLRGHGSVSHTPLSYLKKYGEFHKSNRTYSDYVKDQLNCQYFFIVEDGRIQDIL